MIAEWLLLHSGMLEVSEIRRFLLKKRHHFLQVVLFLPLEEQYEFSVFLIGNFVGVFEIGSKTREVLKVFGSNY